MTQDAALVLRADRVPATREELTVWDEDFEPDESYEAFKRFYRRRRRTDPDGPNTARMRINPLRRPKLWAWTVCVLMVVTGMIFLVLPVTAVYIIDGQGHVHDVQTVYANRSDQVIVAPADLLDPSQPVTLEVFARLSCGTAFTSGTGEADERDGGPPACAAAERPRMIVGWLLVGLGVVGFAGGIALPSARFPVKDAEAQPPKPGALH